MKKEKKLSIITICYNIKDEIEATLKSITKQTWQDFEWIVVDGGSTDGTLDILKKYKKHITVLISEPDKGIYNAMNKGIKIAKGKYLNFMNGGDTFYTDDVLEKIFFKKNPDADVLYGNYNHILASGEQHILQNPIDLKPNFFTFSTINHQSAFVKRELFNKYGLYNENFKIAADWESWIIYITHGCRFEYMPVVVANFMDGGISSTQINNLNKEIEYLRQKYYKKQRTYYLFNIPLLHIECE